MSHKGSGDSAKANTISSQILDLSKKFNFNAVLGYHIWSYCQLLSHTLVWSLRTVKSFLRVIDQRGVTPQLFASLFISNEQCWNAPDLSLAESETGTLRISHLRFAALAQLSRRHTAGRFNGSWEGETISRSSLHLQSAQTDVASTTQPHLEQTLSR